MSRPSTLGMVRSEAPKILCTARFDEEVAELLIATAELPPQNRRLPAKYEITRRQEVAMPLYPCYSSRCLDSLVQNGVTHVQINGIVSRLVLGSTLNLSVPIATATLVFSLDETNPEGLIQREPVSPFTRIVLDSMHGKLYLGVYGGAIKRTNLDGSNREDVLSSFDSLDLDLILGTVPVEARTWTQIKNRFR